MEYIKLISMIPFIELRVTIPLGIAMDLNHIYVYISCLIGLSIVAVPIVLVFRQVIDHLRHRKYFNKVIRWSEAKIEGWFKKLKSASIIGLAANSLVGENIIKPYEYYHNNVYGMMCLLDVMKENNVDKIVFSSTAATYGEPKNIPIMESDETNPTNTYGETKLAMEKMMKWFDTAYGTKYVSFRYFNAAGAYFDGSIGEAHATETHLIPLILQVPLGKREHISIFGSDYDTKDGTCIRDYIHVMDLASAHYKALEYLRNGNNSDIFNLGNGNGYSVKEVIDVARKVTNFDIPANEEARRSGDPAVLIATSEKAKSVLGWKPEFDSLEKIIEDAWRWHSNNPNGFKEKVIVEV